MTTYPLYQNPNTSPIDGKLTVSSLLHPPKYKYHEDVILKQLSDYLAKTYSGHYVGEDNIQTFDVWKALGNCKSTARDTGLKYLMRFGKKNGENPDDILKTIHYCFILLHLLKTENKF